MLASKSSIVEKGSLTEKDKSMKASSKKQAPRMIPVDVATSRLEAPFFTSSASGTLSMKTKPTIALQKSHFASSIVPPGGPNSVMTEYIGCQALLQQQQTEQLNRMLIERALLLHQHSRVMMQQDPLLQMRRMVEMRHIQSRLQNGTGQLQSNTNNNNESSGLMMNNRASAA
jgi:hypothetical protein